MDKVFPNAVEARAGARNNVRIYNEIRDIESAILTAIEQGVLEVDITDTYMTDLDQAGATYAAVWLDEIENRSLSEQMLIVMRHFQDMGYTVTRKLQINTMDGSLVTAVATDGVDPLDPDPGTVEIQRITPGVLADRAVYSLIFDDLELTTLPLGETPVLGDLLIALYATAGYSTAPFVLTTSGNDLVLTWKTVGNVAGVATLGHTVSTSTFKWEVLW